jgi:tetratricopeptide (TPR) repeat protein
LDEAIIYYRRALQLQPDAIATLSSLGNALLEKGQVNEAIVYFQKAVTISPDSAKTHSNLGNAFVRKGRLGEAIVQYEAALRITPNDVPTLSNLSWLLAACPDPSIRNGPKAVELAQMADRISGGKSLSVLRTLSAAYAEVGQFAEAIAAAEKALKMPVVQANTAHADALRSQIKMFDAHSPIRDLSLTNADENFSHQ